MTSAAAVACSSSAVVTTNGHVCPEPSKNKIEASVPEAAAAGGGQVELEDDEEGGSEDDSVNAEYCNALQGLQFDIIEFDESGRFFYGYYTNKGRMNHNKYVGTLFVTSYINLE